MVALAGLSRLTVPALAQTAAPPNYFVPDLPATALVHDGTHFWIKPIIAIVGDYTAFSQDDASVTQVGVQDNMRELRAGRLGIMIRSKSKFPWFFYSTVDYQESRTRDGPAFQLYDLGVGIPLGPVKAFIGKQKESFSYELVELSVVMPQQERILLPFFPTRNIGINFLGPLAGGRMTWAAGAFNDWLTNGLPFARNASDYTGRVTALAWESAGKTGYLHLGAGYRSGGADNGMMEFAGRPESNVADKFTDTGEFAASGSNEVSLEGLVSIGRFAVLTEHIGAWVHAPASGNPYFSGSYLEGSWILTGESRPYLRAFGYAGRVVPKRRFGAVELVARFSHVDLTSGPIDGGTLDKWHVGLNWWASAEWKVGFSYGDADLTKAGLVGTTKMWLTRVQWLY
jgi:phosphate-selective porin OprO and OprP